MSRLLDAFRETEWFKRAVRQVLRSGAKATASLSDRPAFNEHELESVLLSFIETLVAKVEVRRSSVPDVTSFDAEAVRSSDTVFILAGGASVNELDRDDWAHVNAHDAYGVNYWIVHDFVPDMYFYETPKDETYVDFFAKMYERRKDAYVNVPLVVQYPHMRRAGVDVIDRLVPTPREVYFNAPFRYRTHSETLLRTLMRLRRRLESVHPCTLGSLIHHAGSISYLIMFAMIAGYHNIVLIGVDMVDRAYFYDTADANPYYEEMRQVRDAFAEQRSVEAQSSQHPTVDEEVTKSYGEIPLDRYILLFNEIFLRPKGIRLYVNSTRSKLYPELPRYPFESSSSH